MKRLALIAGVVFLLMGVAGFADLLAMPQVYSAVLAVAGVIFLGYGATRQRALIPPRGPGNDMRDFGV
jgi:arginine exporter protein ArgO